MFFRPSKKDGVTARERSLWGDLISMGMVFPIAIVIGYFLGQWVGRFFGYPSQGRIVGLVLGVMSGFWELFKVSKRLEKYDNSNNNNINNDSSGEGDDQGH
ncbi:MAG: AtpZ/AtpI family protein [Holophagaceae bacterium]|nr:AtpZ/AtpI family protein [Holophagaceae bacterium]